MTALSVHNLSKSYPGTKALHGVSMTLHDNEILGLIGQNGSGKSTLLKIFSGVEQPSEGEIRVRGQVSPIPSPLEAARLGIAMVHQEQSLFANLTVAENILFNRSTRNRRLGLYNWRGLNAEARRQLDKLECDIRPDILVSRLSFPDRQLVEFAKMLAVEEMVDHPLTILFDEPTSLLSPSEVDRLFVQIRRLKARASVVFVSHRMDEVLEISDRVHVMSNGENVAERTKASTTHEELYALMVGKPRTADFYQENRRRPLDGAKTRLAVTGLTAPGRFADVNLQVRAGEIVALTGVAGSGVQEVCRAIFGLEDHLTGSVTLDGTATRLAGGPHCAIAAGIGYVAAERKAEGVVIGRTIVENVVLTFGSSLGKHGLINARAEADRALHRIDRLKVKTPDPAEYVERLSGGNQQKVSLAKWLMSAQLRLLMLDCPTRGLDPGAKADLFAVMRDLAEAGLSILFVSETLEETLGMADIVIVMRDGRVTARFTDLHLTKPKPEAIVEAMV